MSNDRPLLTGRNSLHSVRYVKLCPSLSGPPPNASLIVGFQSSGPHFASLPFEIPGTFPSPPEWKAKTSWGQTLHDVCNEKGVGRAVPYKALC